MRRLQLTEYVTETEIELSIKERKALRGVVTISPSVEREGCFDLKPGSWIGVVQVGSSSVQIRPKVPIDRVLFLISYALDPSKWQDTGFDFGEEQSIVEAIVPGFLRQVRAAFRRGLLQGYRTEEDALNTVRGRIRFDDQIRYRYAIAPPIEVRYDEFTEDIEVNRLVKAAIRRLGMLRIRSETLRQSLRDFDGTLSRVSSVEYDSRNLPDISWTRLNEHYRPAVELAKLILRATSFELRHGEVRSTTFLVNMNVVFEDFVLVALRESLGLSEQTLPKGALLHLDTVEEVRMEPDISWWEGRDCVFVGDVKYKRLEAEAVKNADLYQLLSYTIASDLPEGLLVYAAGERDPGTHEVVHVGKELTIVTMDLDGKPEDILGQIDRIAERIRGMRDKSRGRFAA
jgi:5-methylcytosine-specific restriction enzyme subunit McrC